MPVNIEIKARTERLEDIRRYLEQQGARFVGTDKQTDTYFQVPQGRLKLREGTIERNLIWYQRPDQQGPKRSDFLLLPVPDAEALKTLLSTALGVRTTVKKIRDIYYIDNVKFHLDQVEGLGTFVEIEAGNLLRDLPVGQLQVQCDFYREQLGIRDQDLLDQSYSDLLGA